MDYIRFNVYGFKPIQTHKIVKFNFKQRLKRAIVNKNFKLLFVKQIEVANFSASTSNVEA